VIEHIKPLSIETDSGKLGTDCKTIEKN